MLTVCPICGKVIEGSCPDPSCRIWSSIESNGPASFNTTSTSSLETPKQSISYSQESSGLLKKILQNRIVCMALVLLIDSLPIILIFLWFGGLEYDFWFAIAILTYYFISLPTIGAFIWMAIETYAKPKSSTPTFENLTFESNPVHSTKYQAPYNSNYYSQSNKDTQVTEVPNGSILSSSGWSSSKSDVERRRALEKAVQRYGSEKTNNALAWVSNMHRTRNPEVAKKCEEDISWLKRFGK